MAFRLKSDEPELVVSVNIDDGDLNISINGVDIGYISNRTGKLILFSFNESERQRLPGLSLTNGRLTVEAGGRDL